MGLISLRHMVFRFEGIRVVCFVFLRAEQNGLLAFNILPLMHIGGATIAQDSVEGQANCRGVLQGILRARAIGHYFRSG